MTFKRILQYTLTILSSSVLMFSCDKINEPFTQKIVVDTSSIDTSNIDTTEFHQKRILLEDYTGHQCVNCPAAAIIAHNIENTFGDKVVVLAIHAGWFAKATAGGDFTADYNTVVGTEWDTYFGISNVGNPFGMVNRIKYTTSEHILSPEAWSTEVFNMLEDTVVTVDLNITNLYNIETRKLDTEIVVEYLQVPDKDLSLIVVLKESGIVSPQKNNAPSSGPTPIIYDYVHNNVLRDAINGTWGSVISGISSVGTVKKSYSYTLKDNFVAENCKVVAFIYDEDTKQIFQVAEKEVIIE